MVKGGFTDGFVGGVERALDVGAAVGVALGFGATAALLEGAGAFGSIAAGATVTLPATLALDRKSGV